MFAFLHCGITPHVMGNFYANVALENPSWRSRKEAEQKCFVTFSDVIMLNKRWFYMDGTAFFDNWGCMSFQNNNVIYLFWDICRRHTFKQTTRHWMADFDDKRARVKLGFRETTTLLNFGLGSRATRTTRPSLSVYKYFFMNRVF